MGSALDEVARLPGMTGVDRTVLLPKASGNLAPSVFRRMWNDTSVAMWFGKDGRPTRAVGYAEDGSPAWAYDGRSRKFTRETSALRTVPSRDDALDAMSRAISGMSQAYEATKRRMLRSVNPLTHRVEERADGFVLVRDLTGRLDNPRGSPACLAPDGRVVYAISGKRMGSDAYRTALSQGSACVGPDGAAPAGSPAR